MSCDLRVASTQPHNSCEVDVHTGVRVQKGIDEQAQASPLAKALWEKHSCLTVGVPIKTASSFCLELELYHLHQATLVVTWKSQSYFHPTVGHLGLSCLPYLSDLLSIPASPRCLPSTYFSSRYPRHHSQGGGSWTQLAQAQTHTHRAMWPDVSNLIVQNINSCTC
jgi:hypothetical protein